MTLMTVHADKQPSFLAAEAEVFSGEARQVELDGFLVFSLLHHERAVQFVVQWIAHRMWADALRYGLKVAVEDLCEVTKPYQTVNFRVLQRHTDRRQITERILKFSDPALFF